MVEKVASNGFVVLAQWSQRARLERGSLKQSWALTAGVTVRPADKEGKKMKKSGRMITTAL